MTASGLLVGYDAIPVCPQLDLALRPGQVLAVIGANGSGKTTVLHTLLGLQQPLGGEATLLGRAPEPRSASQRAGVAHVLGPEAFFPALTVAEHLRLVAVGHGVAQEAGELEALLADFGLEQHGDVLPGALSSGQRRRALLAAAFVRPWSLLVLDEPEQRLDAGMRRRLAAMIAAEAAAGGAVLLACHDPLLVSRAASSVLLLEPGGVRQLTAAAAAAAIEAL